MLPNLGFLAGNGTVLYNGRHAKRSINMRSDRKVMTQTRRYPSMFNDGEIEARLSRPRSGGRSAECLDA